MKKIFLLLLLPFLLQSCGASYQLKKQFKKDKNHFFKGFVLYNPDTKQDLVNYNGEKYFTPASTTKLFTFYTAYTTLPDSLATFSIYENDTAIVLKAQADPSLLYGIPNKALAYSKSSQAHPLPNLLSSICCLSSINSCFLVFFKYA